jgi:hypothetical protein
MASRRTYPIPNKKLSSSDYIQNKRAKQLFSGTSNLAKTIEQQNGNFPLVTPLGKLKPYQGTFGLSGRYDTSPSDKTYCLNTSHSYRDLLAITKGKYLLTPPNISDENFIKIEDVNDPTKLYNGIYYVYIYFNTTNALYYMNPPYPDPSGNYVPNQINYDVTGNANERIIVDPSFNLNYESQSCILRPKLSQNIGINNNYDARYSFNRTINLDLFSGFQYPVKFSLDYDTGDCINASNDLQSKYAFPSTPYNILSPVISGAPTLGSTLTLTNNGTWGGTPTPTYTYQWYRGSTEISGANNKNYIIVGSDIQQLITCQVTGTNSTGSSNSSSNHITPSDPPDTKTRPTISGSASVDSILSISTTELWSGYPAPTLTYQWYRVDTPIPSATNNSYTIVTDDVGQSITCRVKGTNTSGSFTAISINSITPTGPPGINNNDTPLISGNALIGSTLTLTNARTWNGYPAPTLTYQWYRGDTPIYGQNNTTYVTVNAIDIEQLITCHVTGTNTSGSFTAISNSISPYIETTQCNQQ